MRNWGKNRSYCNRNCKLTNAITAIATLFSCSWYQLNPLSFFLYTSRGTLMEIITTEWQTNVSPPLVNIYFSSLFTPQPPPPPFFFFFFFPPPPPPPPPSHNTYFDPPFIYYFKYFFTHLHRNWRSQYKYFSIKISVIKYEKNMWKKRFIYC